MRTLAILILLFSGLLPGIREKTSPPLSILKPQRQTPIESQPVPYSRSPRQQPTPIDWATTREWRLYAIHSKKAYAWPADTLSHFGSVALNQDTMTQYLKNISKIPMARTPVWMGYYVASCRLPNDSLLKLEVSEYGRFFYCEKDHSFYQLGEEAQNDWQPYLTSKLKTMESVAP